MFLVSNEFDSKLVARAKGYQLVWMSEESCRAVSLTPLQFFFQNSPKQHLIPLGSDVSIRYLSGAHFDIHGVQLQLNMCKRCIMFKHVL